MGGEISKITPMRLATLVGVHGSVGRYGLDAAAEPMTVPLYSYLVERGDGGLVVFDLGCGAPDAVEAYGRPTVTDHRTPAQAVVSLGRDPGEVSAVVVSHLHWDHCVGMDEFENARVLVQRAELRFAFAPNPEQWRPYDSWEIGRRAAWLDHCERIDPVDGYLRLTDDLLIVPTPGHTPGSQSLLVASHRSYLLCGDLFMNYDSWLGVAGRPGSGGSRAAPGLHTDLEDWRDSMDLIEKHNWTPLPAHDPRVVDVVAGRWYPWRSVAASGSLVQPDVRAAQYGV